MSRRERRADELYEAQNDQPPVSGTIHDSSYARHIPKQEPIDVVEDQEDNGDTIEPEAGFDTTLNEHPARDENEDIDTRNILKGRTRRAKPRSETKYGEGPDYGEDLGF